MNIQRAEQWNPNVLFLKIDDVWYKFSSFLPPKRHMSDQGEDIDQEISIKEALEQILKWYGEFPQKLPEQT